MHLYDFKFGLLDPAPSHRIKYTGEKEAES